MKKIYLLLILAVISLSASAQVTAIDPNGDGGFESGTTFAANGWTTVNPGTNALWQIGTAVTGYSGSRGVFVGPNATTNSYTTTSSRTCHFYRDVAIPAGATAITLSFSLKGNGEVGWDRLLVFTAPTSVTPVSNSPSSNSTTITDATLVYTQSMFFSSYTTQTVTLPVSLAGTTVRLIFTWQNDASSGTTPPAAVDNISLVYTPAPPCTGTPTAGTVSASKTVGCTTYSSSLSLTGTTVGTGITYQWQSSPNNSTWTSVSGATNSTYSASVTSAIYYRCQVGCTSSGLSASTTGQLLSFSTPVYATLPFTESFESSWIDGCATADKPNAFWVNTPSTGNSSWRREDDGAGSNTAGWTSGGTGTYSPSSSAGSHSARFHARYASSGTTGALDLYVDFSTAGTKQITYNYINNSGTDNIVCQVSTNGGSTFTTLDAPPAISTSWSTRTTSTTATSATAIVRFLATSDFGADDIGLDNINIVVLPPCTGTPDPGNTLASATSVCSGGTTNLSLQNTISGSGVTYQWKSAPDVSGSAGTYTNITGATNSTYSPTISATTWYKCDVTCSGNTGTSTAVKVNLGGTITSFPATENFDAVTTPALPCGWTRIDVNGDGSTWQSYVESPAGGSTPNVMRYNYSSSNAANDWLFTPPITMTVGKTYRLTFKYGSNSTSYTEALEVKWGNAATVAGMTSSAIFSNTSISNTTLATTGNIDIVPSSSGTYYIGFHAISIANQFYLYLDDVNIQELTPCAGTPAPGNTIASAISVCSGNTSTLSLQNATIGTGVTYQWKSAADVSGSPGSYSNISGATNATYTATLTSTTWYKCDVTCSFSSATGTSTQVQVAIGTGAITSASFPYTQNFDDVTTPALPCGWTYLDVNGDGSTWQSYAAGSVGGSTPNVMRYNYNLSNAANDWLFTPPITMTVGKTYRLTFKYGNNSATYTERLEVKWGNAATVAGMTSGAIFSNTAITNMTTLVASGNIDIVPGSSGTYYIGFHAISGINQYYLYIDDVKIEEFCTTTPNLSNFSTSASSPCVGAASTVTINSTSQTAGTYTITYNVAGANPATGSTASITMASNTGTFTIPAGSLASTGSNTITVTSVANSFGCTSTPASGNTSSFSVNPLPSVSSFTTTATSPCAGAAATVTINSTSLAAGTYTISYDLSGANSGSASTSITMAGNTGSFTIPAASLPASGSTTVQINRITTAASCFSTVSSGNTSTFTVNALPTAVTASGAGTFCGSASISASNGGSGTIYYQGTTPNGTSTALGGTPQSVTSSGTYYFRAQSAAGCWGAQGSVVVSVNPVPDVSNFSIAASSLCLGSASTVTISSTSIGNGTYTITYDIGGANLSTSNTTSVTMAGNTGTFTIPSASLPIAGATTVTITSVTNSATCSSTPGSGNTASFNVNAIPAPVSATGAGIFCGSTTIAASNGGDGTIYYQGTTSNGTSTALGGSPQTITGTNTYYFRAQSAAGCWSPQGSVAVTVNPQPAATTVAGGGTYCGSTTITASGGTGGTIYFQGTTSGGTSTATPATSAVISISGTYYFRSQTSAGCWGAEGSAILTINPVPTAAPTNDGHICIGGVVNLTANASGGATVFTWSGSNLTANTVANTSAHPAASTVYSLTVSDGSGNPGCSPSTIYTTSVTVNAVPTAAPTNNSPICVGGTVALTANPAGSTTTYSWSGSSLSSSTDENPTATPGATEIYSLVVSDGSGHSGCSPSTVYTTSVTVNPAPSLTMANNDGPVCEGTTLNLTANGAANVTGYSWSGPVTITNASTASASVPSATTAASGVYTVTVNNNTGSGCTATYTTSATVNPLPTVADITPSADNICVNAPLTLVAGTATGSGTASYDWSGPNGYTANTTGNTATLTPATTAASGQYTLTVTYPGTGCTSNPVTSIPVTVNDLPTVSGIVVSPGVLCANNPITLTAGSTTGAGSLVSYNWSGPNGYSSTSASSTQTYTVPNAGASGVYSLSVTYSGVGCTSSHAASNNVTVKPLPTAYNITGGGIYCSGGSGVHVGLDNSDLGINYQLYHGSTALGSPIAGTGSAIDFGLQTAAGTYSVSATNTTTSCVNDMNGVTTVTISITPSIYTVTGGGNYCGGGAGVHIGLTSSDVSVGYQVYKGATAIGGIVPGTGTTLDLGLFTAAGTYTVVANPSAACAVNMAGSATIGINPPPTQYNVTGGGSYCAGGNGVHIGMDWSVSGVSYQLYNGATTVGAPVAGAASGLDFGLITGTGTYTVLATNTSTNCTNSMAGSVTVAINPTPAVYAVTGGGNYCIGGSGAPVGLSGSNTGINYQLYLGSSSVGGVVAGTGSAVSFGNQQTAGTYTVTAIDATTLCASSMTGSATVGINPAPTAFAVNGGGSYCAGGAGRTIGLAGSTIGVTYQLYNGASAVGSPVAGTSAALNFGLQTTAGTYTVLATTTATSCTGAMSSNAVISIDPLPAAYAVTGGGLYCSGGTGVPVGLANSAVGISYQLYRGATSVGSPVSGTGSAISFGNQTIAGTYSVVATNGSTNCTSAMTGTAVIGTNPMPAAYDMTGGGSFCTGGAGVSIGLSSSATGINYQLYRGATAIGGVHAGSGTAIDFGTQVTAGTYTVQATNATTGCTLGMSGSAVVSINALPTVFNVTGGGAYCAGGGGQVVGLAGSAAGDVYQLYHGSTPVGTPVSGTGAAISFGPQTAGGTYTVAATTSATGCTNHMGGLASIIVNPLPTAFTVGGGGAYCTGGPGVVVNLSSSTVGVNYQLYQGSTAIGIPVSGTGSPIDFGLQTTAGTYSVSAINSTTTCASNMSGTATVNVNALPTVFAVTGGGSYCSGSAGVSVGLSNSQAGVNYQLYRGATPIGSPVAGTGSSISFGAMSVIGSYTVVAANASTGCVSNMSGSATVSVNALPTVYNVIGGGSYCAGGAGVSIGTNNSATGVNYQLYLGAAAIGSPVAGSNGVGVSFGTLTTAGTYSVLATTTSNGCAAAMNGTASIDINPLPTALTVTGGGSYCNGGAGVTVGLSGSVTGVNYQLYNGSSPVGSAVAGTGSALSFGSLTSAGTYTVAATNATTNCSSNMTGSAVISVNALPTAFTVTGGGNFCNGGSGVSVGLSGSTSGVNYQLYRGSTAVGSQVAGTGSSLNFGIFTTAGVYTVSAVNASTGCGANMTGSASISINALPIVYNVSGGGSYCSGGEGVNVGLSGTSAGVNYQLYNGSTTVGSPVAGTGGSVNFGLQTTAGTYTVFATNTSTGCTSGMSGNATVVVNAQPTAFSMTGGGSYCSGGSGVAVGLNGSTSGVNYQLFRGAIAMSAQVPGTGTALTFGSQTAAGVYTVVATNASTTCTNNMTGSATVSINTTPSVYNVTGGGSFCVGGSGVIVGLDGSSTGVNYRLYNGSTPVSSSVGGTGLPISFGSQLAAGTYTVAATSTSSSCGAGMAGNALVTVNNLPIAYTVVGGGVLCSGSAGVVVGLSNSTNGVNYQLYNGTSTVGTAVAGTGSSLSFGMQTNAGSYSVVATNASSGCFNNMNGNVSVIVNAQPVAYNVTGGGSFCSGGTGVAVGLGGSNAGISYQLYNGSVATGSPVAGTGGAISFGNITSTGTYSVLATNGISGCTNAMNGTAGVIANPSPAAYLVNGGGNYCSGGGGVVIGLSGSSAGIKYQLYNGSSVAGAPVTGTGAPINFGSQLASGTYTVLATDAATLCATAMTGNTSVSVNAVPVVYTVTGGGNYCAGGTGSVVGLANSESGVTYQLYRGGVALGSPVPGTGTALSFGPQLVAGAYSVAATNISGCSSNMTGVVSVGINAQPAVYAVGGGGSFCADGVGVNVTLSGSNTGIDYQIFNGSTATGLMSGTGSAINFGLQSIAGTYTVQAVNPSTGCVRNMTGSATVVVNPLPTAYAITGGGNYCSGGTGVIVGLSNSNSGINYQLFNGTTAVSAPIAGSGAALSFGSQTATGVHTVRATNALTGCSATMTGTATVGVNAQPVAYAVTGGGSYCAGGTGVNVTLGGSASGVDYQLYNGSSPVGAAVSGTGSGISFGPQTAAGSYSIMATNTSTGCSGGMTGSVSVVVNSLPTVYSMTGGGTYCSGGNGVVIGLANSASGVVYQLYNGTTAVGTALPGTGSAISFGQQTAGGSYSVVATANTSGCTATMAGTASISINAAPTVYTVSGGGNYCAGGNGAHILLSGSNTDVLYQAYNGATAVGGQVAGTGSALDLGAVFAAGTYTVLATNAATSCTSSMTGGVAVNVNAAPIAYAVTGGGNYCAGSGGALVGLNNSQSGVAYQLYIGTTAVGSPVNGTGSALSFGQQPAAGTYTVSATNSTTGCKAAMTGIATVAVNPLPAAYTVTGGGNYCAGTAGVHVGLTGSSTTDYYQLYNGASAVGSPIAGTGTSIDFGVFNTTGTYSVVALNSTMTCGRNMTGSVSVGVNALPTVYAVNGGGAYCSGGSGVVVGMANSATGINYQLYNGAAIVGSPVAGTGSAIDFGSQTANGTYSVLATNATTGCSRSMSGTALVSANSLPSAYNVTGGGSYCESGTGAIVGLSSSASGINYRVYMAGSPMSAMVAGTGSPISFGPQTVAGTYTVLATNASTGCTRVMMGSALVSITPAVLPSVSIIKSTGSDSVCQGTEVAFSATAVNGGTSPVYEWRVNGLVVGSGSSYSYAPANHDVITASLTSSAACALPSIVTNTVAMTVNPAFTPVVAVMLPSNTVCAGTSVTFTAAASYGGTAPVYSWMKNGVNVGSGSTYTYLPDNGDLVYCGMTSNYACRTLDNVTSTITHMVVNEPPVPVVTITANPGTNISKGQAVTFAASVANGGANPTFQWKLNGNAVSGATSFNYSGNNFANNDVVSCEVTSTSPCGTAKSTNSVTLSVSTVGVINVAAANIDVNVIPNPNKGEFTVKGNLATTDDVEVTLEVVNMLGQTIYNNKVMANNGKINEHIKLDNTLASGMYMLNLRSAGGSKVFHVVVEQ